MPRGELACGTAAGTVRKTGCLPERDRNVFLQPGDVWYGAVPALVKTVLGSCLAITMRAPRLGLAAVTHCLLPKAGSELQTLAFDQATKYVDTTMEMLFDTFWLRGIAPEELEIKLIGGADNLLTNRSPHKYSVGLRNVEEAQTALARRGVKPAASIVGGRTGRVMVFDTETGEVFVKMLPGPRRGCREEA